MDNELINIEDVDIQNLIYTIRGKQVMLDKDVANLYHCETKRINEKLKRNIKRFPKDFCFQLTEEEFKTLRSQIATSKIEADEDEHRGGRRYLPHVFTEQRNFNAITIITK